MPLSGRSQVFVSSTFRDIMGEWGELMPHTWPELRRFCRERQVELVEVDLLWGVSDSTMQGYKQKLAQAVKEFMGTDVLTLVVKQPAWKSNLVAMRERQVGRAWQS